MLRKQKKKKNPQVMKFQEKLSLSAASAIWSLLTVIIKLMEYCKIKCNAKIHAISKYKNKSFLIGKTQSMAVKTLLPW